MTIAIVIVVVLIVGLVAFLLIRGAMGASMPAILGESDLRAKFATSSPAASPS